MKDNESMKEKEENENRHTEASEEKIDRPGRQFYIPSQIVDEFGEKGRDHLNKKPRAQFLLALTAGSFMTFGAVFSILLAIDIQAEGLFYLMSGLGFAAGYAMVFISGAVLFTEVNVLLPSYLFNKKGLMKVNIYKFWLATYLGNMIGAFAVGLLIQMSGSLSDPFYSELAVYVDKKMKFLDYGVKGWFEILVSGILANWLIGMAAFLTTSARDITGKILGTTLPVILFVAGNFQHSAANMGYFSMGILSMDQYTWYEYIFFNLVPASIGNLIGGGILVSLLFTYAYKEDIENTFGMGK
ncbi:MULTISPECIES: formate/nitrite transporter family protein [Salimicrobium]|uniref:Formate dehydrogenase n=3 Tax=Salimicrobium TaxID=351195 RepID=K2GJH2_9BACI|nr:MULTISPECIES: formate/nitrite transporter family protein [Salimicrobium]AKG04848.1 formate dehydrogenase [Salimicrobium jeotgali]EKE30594.1 formate/nitrite transporter [Salimicrobium jeotgali]MBM7696828.1 formate transporter [Salimicrobium jeotgali]SDX40794.1 formate transporter [Salimicrobium album]SIS46389.1 formate transporter [Salimicrobium salexigens]